MPASPRRAAATSGGSPDGEVTVTADVPPSRNADATAPASPPVMAASSGLASTSGGEGVLDAVGVSDAELLVNSCSALAHSRKSARETTSGAELHPDSDDEGRVPEPVRARITTPSLAARAYTEARPHKAAAHRDDRALAVARGAMVPAAARTDSLKVRSCHRHGRRRLRTNATTE